MNPVSTACERAVDLDVDGVGVAADARVGLEHGHLVVAVQHVRRDEPGHAGADDRRSSLHRLDLGVATSGSESTHQFQSRSASPSARARPRAARSSARGRRSSQNCAVRLARLGRGGQPHHRVGALLGVRSSGRITRRKPGSDSVHAGRVGPARVHRVECDPTAGGVPRPELGQHDLGPLGVGVGAHAVERVAGGCASASTSRRRVYMPPERHGDDAGVGARAAGAGGAASSAGTVRRRAPAR